MPYTPTNWQTGDIITAAKLNNIEQGIVSASGGGSGGGILQLYCDGQFYSPVYYDDAGARAGTQYTPAPVSEILSAYEAGLAVLLRIPYPYNVVVPLLYVNHDGDDPEFANATNLSYDEDEGRWQIWIGKFGCAQDDYTFDYPVWVSNGFSGVQFYAPTEDDTQVETGQG